MIYVAVEDSWKYTIVPRLMAAGADLDLVYRAEVAGHRGRDRDRSACPPTTGCSRRRSPANDVALVALDPLMSAISDTLDTHVNRQVRQALDPLARIADRTGAIVAGIAHFNKSSGTDASSLITASGAFKDVARFIFAFAADDEDGPGHHPDQEQPRPQRPAVAGLPASSRPPCRPRRATPGSAGSSSTARPTAPCRTSSAPRTVQERDEKTRAEDYLRKALADGPRPTKDVEEEAREATGSAKRTLERARTCAADPGREGRDRLVDLAARARGRPSGPRRTAKPSPAKTAKTAKPCLPGEVGGVGGVTDPSLPKSWPEGTAGADANR